MRYSNPYHKFTFRGKFRNNDSTDGLGYHEDTTFTFRGDFNDNINKELQYILKGFGISTENTAVITRENTNLEVNDLIQIDGEYGIISKVFKTRVKSLNGSKSKGLVWDYIYVIEQ